MEHEWKGERECSGIPEAGFLSKYSVDHNPILEQNPLDARNSFLKMVKKQNKNKEKRPNFDKPPRQNMNRMRKKKLITHG